MAGEVTANGRYCCLSSYEDFSAVDKLRMNRYDVYRIFSLFEIRFDKRQRGVIGYKSDE